MRFPLNVLLVGLFCQHVSADLFSQAGPGMFDDETPLISEVNFSDAEFISDLDIDISGLNYDWVGDLVITLTSPSGTSADIVRRIGQTNPTSGTDLGSFSNFSGDYTFSDDGADIWEAAVDPADPPSTNFVVPPGDYYASTASTSSPSVQVMLAETFGGESTQGTWTLLVEDFDEDSDGSITGWSISTVSSVPEPSSLGGMIIAAMALLIGTRTGRTRAK